MGQISSSVGLVSGLDIGQIVTQLMQIERRPVDRLLGQADELATQKNAYLDLTARLLAVRAAATALGSETIFGQRTVTVSDPTALSAVASSQTPPGAYSLTVQRLATTHQLVSQGFPDSDFSTLSKGSITIEMGQGRLDPSTLLEQLNLGQGVRRGQIAITDRSGSTAQIDLSSATAVDDVLKAINSESGISVEAFVRGDRIVLADSSGSTGFDLTVSDLDGGRAAEDLGILGGAAANEFEGQDRNNLGGMTPVEMLNNGNGVRTSDFSSDLDITLGDGTNFQVDLSESMKVDTSLSLLNAGSGVSLGAIRVQDRAGGSADIDLTTAQTVGDVVDAINGAGIQVTAAFSGDHLTISDSSGEQEGELIVEDIGGGSTASDLGIRAETDEQKITGRAIYSVNTVGDVLRLVNYHAAEATGLSTDLARIGSDGNRIELADPTGVGSITVAAIGTSDAASDLGILGSSPGTLSGASVLSGLNTVLLKGLHGGSGVAAGQIQLTDRSGVSSSLDLSAAESLQEIIDAINESSNAGGARVVAELNKAGNGIVLGDLSGGAGNLVIADLSGSLAEDLGIAVDDAVRTVQSGNLQLQYLNENTRLSDLNGGRGVAAGRIRIFDSTGRSSVVDLSQGDEETVGDVIREINSRGIGVTATINATGDGLLLTETAGGQGILRVEEDGGSTAADLGILGEANEGQTTIDGSFEYVIEVQAGDRLDDLVQRINDANIPISAGIINDGSSINPLHMTVTSERSGRIGRLILDAGDTGLDFGELISAQDAVVQIGDPQQGVSLMATSSTNSVEDLVPGLDLTLNAVSSSPVTVTVDRSSGRAAELGAKLVEGLNSLLSRIDELTDFDVDAGVRQPLFGEYTPQQIESSLFRMINGRANAIEGRYDFLYQVGIDIAAGGRIEFNETRFREAIEEDPDSVVALFTDENNGVAKDLEDLINSFTDAEDGRIVRRTDALTDQETLLNDRIGQLERLLDSRRERLTDQFLAMETALARMQAQQNALSGLTLLSANTSSRNL
jgi:flagellar hook-associated protein 2